MWEKIYQAPNSANWMGRDDALPNSCFFQVVQCHDLQVKFDSSHQQPAFALLGFACDAGVKRNQGRIGAKEGPDVIRRALGALPIKRMPLVIYDVGNVICHDDELEAAQSALGDVVEMLLQHHITPIILGGGHEVAWGHYQGVARELDEKALSIVNFDAHFDIRPLLMHDRGSSGTPFLQIANDRLAKKQSFDYTCIGVQEIGNTAALEQTANRLHIHTVHAEEIHEEGIRSTQSLLERVGKQCDALYVSLCLDVFASPFAPGVSAPQILGLMPWQVIRLLRDVIRTNKVVSYDIAEYNPAFDIDARTAKLAASLIYEIIHHHDK